MQAKEIVRCSKLLTCTTAFDSKLSTIEVYVASFGVKYDLRKKRKLSSCFGHAFLVLFRLFRSRFNIDWCWFHEWNFIFIFRWHILFQNIWYFYTSFCLMGFQNGADNSCGGAHCCVQPVFVVVEKFTISLSL